jgi:serine phosphatase RsbU (regulator of sigma subunit)
MSLAGHDPPLVLRGDGTVEPVGQLGTVLGLFEEVDLSTSKVVLSPGELICLFTDGLVEARDGQDLFGSERVATLLAEHGHGPVDQLADELVAAARQFHRGRRLADDLAILILRVSAHENDGPVLTVDPPGNLHHSTDER